MQLLSLHSYSLRFAMAACRAADAKPDLPRLDYISCKKRKNIAIVALNGLSINDITVGVIRNQLFIEYWPSKRQSRPGPNHPFFIANQLFLITFCSKSNTRGRRYPRWPSLGHFRPSCCPRWSWMGLNYPFFIGNQLILNTFCSRIVPRRRRCPRWPSLGHFRPSCRPRWSWMGLNYPFFIGNQLLLNTFCSTCNPRA